MDRLLEMPRHDFSDLSNYRRGTGQSTLDYLVLYLTLVWLDQGSPLLKRRAFLATSTSKARPCSQLHQVDEGCFDASLGSGRSIWKEDPPKTLCHSRQLQGDSEGLREERTDMCLGSHIIGTE